MHKSKGGTTELSIPSLKEIRESIGLKVSKDASGMPILEAHTTKQIKTLEGLLEEANYSLDEWEVERSVANVWHQMSTTNGLVPLWQVKATLRRRDLSPDMISDLISKGLSAFKKAIAMKLPQPRLNPSSQGVMVEFNQPDLHLGKLAWSEETGHGNWDIKIAAKAYREGLEDLISRSPDANEAWLLAGSDFYNVDSDTKMTTAGTVQDEEGRWQKSFIVGEELMQWAIGRLRKKYPVVRVIIIPGNHDGQWSFYLGRCLDAFFRNEKSIIIDNRPLRRKYYSWGNTGLGYAHGNDIKSGDLGSLCQYEAREIWGATKRFEMHIGHLHQDIVKTIGGVIVRWVPALCPPESWHNSKGYVMSEKASMAFVYDQDGMKNMIVHYPNPELFS